MKQQSSNSFEYKHCDASLKLWQKQMSPVCGKTSGLDHSWPDNIEHLEPKLSICCLAMYDNCNLPGEKWSISPAFAPNTRLLIILLNPLQL